jgi:hypothetical protein
MSLSLTVSQSHDEDSDYSKSEKFAFGYARTRCLRRNLQRLLDATKPVVPLDAKSVALRLSLGEAVRIAYLLVARFANPCDTVVETSLSFLKMHGAFAHSAFTVRYYVVSLGH